MDTIKRLINTKTLQINRFVKALERGQSIFMYHDKISDMLILSVAPPTTETIVHYIDDHVGLLYDPSSYEVVGFQIEAFEHSFMPEHASMQQVWKISDATKRPQDMGELNIVFERQKKNVAWELKKSLLSGNSLLPSVA